MERTTELQVARVRKDGLDRLRGLALALMFLDHAIISFVGWWGMPSVRLTITRLSLPLFMLVAGALWRRGWRGRYGEVLLAGALVLLVGGDQLVGFPGILLVFLLCVPVLLAPGPLLLVLAVVGWIQAEHWPLVALLDPWWSDYEPGTVVGWLVLGRLASAHVVELGERVPAYRWLSWLGRYPLTFYVGHVTVLMATSPVGALG